MTCGKQKGFLDKDYSGIDIIGSGAHAFPQRITPRALPQAPPERYLCKECANRTSVRCSAHGRVDGSFSFGVGFSVPECQKCKEELATLSSGELPTGFSWVMSYSQGNTNGLLALSKSDSLIHNIVSGKCEKSLPLTAASFTLAVSESGLSIEVTFGGGSSISIDLNDIVNLEKSIGPWYDMCRNDITARLGTNNPFSLVSIEKRTVAKETFSSITQKHPVALCSILNGELTVFPGVEVPSFAKVSCWRTSETDSDKELDLKFIDNGDPIVLNIKPVTGIGADFFSKQTSQLLRQYKVNNADSEYELEDMGIFQATCYPENRDISALIALNRDIRAANVTVLGKKTDIAFKFGYSYQDSYVLMNEYNAICLRTDEKSKLILEQVIEAPAKLLKQGGGYLGFFFNISQRASLQYLYISEDSFSLDDKKAFDINTIKSISATRFDNGLYRLELTLEDGSNNGALVLLSPAGLTYDAWEKLEIASTRVKFKNMGTQDLYKKCNELRRDHLTSLLFCDVALLKQEMDHGMRFDELAQKLIKSSDEGFEQDMTLKDETAKKMLIFNLLLPYIRQRFETYANLYPYYWLKYDAEWITDAFDINFDNSKTFSKAENKKLLARVRANVRSVNSNMLRCLSEMQNTSRLLDGGGFEKQGGYSSQLFQLMKVLAIPVGTAIATHGVSLIADVMVGLAAITHMKNASASLEKQKISIVKLKKSALNTYQWWSVLIETLSVAACEFSDFVDDEMVSNMVRDKALREQVEKKVGKEAALSRHSEALRNAIVKELRLHSSELSNGSGNQNNIRLKMLISEIEDLKNGKDSRIESFITTLPFSYTCNVEEV